MSPLGSDNLCGKCKLELPKSGDHPVCGVCHVGYHYDECSIKPQTWKKMASKVQEEWVCAVCRKRKGSSNTNPLQTENPEDQEKGNEDFEVSSLGISKEILSKVDNLLLLKDKIVSMEKSLTFLASKYDEIVNEVTSLRNENKDLKKEVEKLKEKEQSNQAATEQLTAEVASLDQYGRRCNLEIHGISIEGDSRTENLKAVLGKVASNIEVPFDPQAIHRAHRLQPRRDGKPATVLVQFFSKDDRDTWLSAGKRKRMPGVFFNENLCPYYRGLLRDTKVKARALNFSYVWWQGGKILVRRSEGDRRLVAIQGRADLKKLRVDD